MKTRKLLILAIVLTVLIAGVTLPAAAEQNKTNYGQEKKAGATDQPNANPNSNANANANSNDKKDNTSSATITPVPEVTILTTATPTISPTPIVYATAQNEKLKVSNIHKPDKTTAGTTVTAAGTPGAATSLPADEGKTVAEKAQADKKIRVTLNQIDVYVKWVQKSRLSESEKAELIREAMENRDWYLQMGEAIEAAPDSNDLQARIAQVDQYNGVLKADLKKNAGLLACDDVSSKIETARNVSALAAEKIAAAKAGGKNTAQLEQLHSGYNAHVDAAAVHTSTAKAYFASITGPADSGKLFSDGYGELQRAETELTLAYEDLKNIYKLLFGSQ